MPVEIERMDTEVRVSPSPAGATPAPAPEPSEPRRTASPAEAPVMLESLVLSMLEDEVARAVRRLR